MFTALLQGWKEKKGGAASWNCRNTFVVVVAAVVVVVDVGVVVVVVIGLTRFR